MSYSGFNRITISENGSLEWIKVIGPQDFSELNLVEKKINYTKPMSLIFSALNKVPLDSLKNIKITKSENVIELAYEITYFQMSLEECTKDNQYFLIRNQK